MARRAPTVDDLRVKLCYICREEERYDDTTINPPRAWTHPCKCTLVAHEKCLLKWIQTSQGTLVRAANALRCPQCGAEYQLESKYPVLLKFMSAGNRTLQQLGRLFTLFGVASFICVVGSGIYVIFTTYGAWALRKFIGTEMFDILLTDDPANWPWSAFLNLPSIPISLVFSRAQHAASIPLIIPLLLIWPPAYPVGLRRQLLREYWTDPKNARQLALTALPSKQVWPPSPLVFGVILVPLVRAAYRMLYSRLALWAAVENAGQQQQQVQHRFFNRVLWRWNGLAVGIRGVRVVRDQGGNNQNEGQPEADNGANAPNNAIEGVRDDLNQNIVLDPEANANEDRAAAVVEAAEQQIEVNTTSLGRQIGGALLIPAISSWMGSLLLRLSRRSDLLRRLLGIKPWAFYSGRWYKDGVESFPGGLLLFPPPPYGPWSYGSWDGLSTWQKYTLTIRLAVNATWGGTRTWAESDPVWWRNSIGLGLFVVAKDCLQLLHLWLTKRELETRRVRNRDFSGVDVNELDLIPTWGRD
ncbi:hypothetical protein F5887DRAFT_883022 [Amanita rubescens]|nr:hypothetical protein F5887DRAFT_883022 [Amanita rubescens]